MNNEPVNIAREEKGMGLATVQRGGEIAVASMAAKAKAMVEAKFVIAMNRPRNLAQARIKILEACRRPYFAASAIYAKPIGGTKITGPSIRFAETAIQCMTNIDVSTTTIYEDDDDRTVNIAVVDLESNLSYSKDVTISKTVERRSLAGGREAISQRLNTNGDRVYLVLATEDELANKIASAESKVIRNCGLRLVPQDIIEEAIEVIGKTRAGETKDPKAESKRVMDAFASINVSPLELEKYIGHGLDTISPSELEDLRNVFTAIKDGESSWVDFMKSKNEDAPKAPQAAPTFNAPASAPAPSSPAAASSKAENATPANQDASTKPAAAVLPGGERNYHKDFEQVFSDQNITFDQLIHCEAVITDKTLPDPTSYADWNELPLAWLQNVAADPKRFKKILASAKAATT